MTFQDVWTICNSIPGSFTETNASALWTFAKLVPEDGWIAEVGVDQGRSTSLLLNAAKPHQNFILVDSWESCLIENKPKVERLIASHPPGRWASLRLLHMTSAEAARAIERPLHLVHIDANHYDDHPAEDCRLWLPKLVPGGVACFHDYQSSFPAVTEAIDHYTKDWEVVGNFEGLAIRRKL